MTLAEIQALVNNGVQENLHLEYKAAKGIGDKEEITKDVSSFANASGGTIIYGVSEFQEKAKRHLPEKIDPISGQEFNREYLDQVINNIDPRIPNVEIDPIEVSQGLFIYVVNVPKGETAHQAQDFKYHRRYNFQCLPMSNGEILDVLNRSKNPKVCMDFEIEQKTATTFELRPFLVNEGSVLAEHVRCIFDIPSHPFNTNDLNGEPIVLKMNNPKDYYRFDVTNDSQIIHAGLRLKLKRSFRISDLSKAALESSDPLYFASAPIEWRVNADNAPIEEGKVDLLEIWHKKYSQ